MDNKTPHTIAILMATYNGQDYLAEQIESILSQDSMDWHLYIHDDGSTDLTQEILSGYADRYPQQITLLTYPPQGGAMYNFMSLLSRVDAPYYMFSDQDDVWLPSKVRKFATRIQEEEAKNPNTPIIVYSDLYVTDTTLNIIHNSFLTYSGIHPQFINTFAEGAATGFVTGCAMCLNQKAKEVTRYPFDKAQMHDAWITLCVLKAHGVVAFIPESLVYYRQHAHNSLGARDVKNLTWQYRLRNIRKITRGHIEHYRMLKALDYGPFAKYVINKFIYRRRINRYRRQTKR